MEDYDDSKGNMEEHNEDEDDDDEAVDMEQFEESGMLEEVDLVRLNSVVFIKIDIYIPNYF